MTNIDALNKTLVHTLREDGTTHYAKGLRAACIEVCIDEANHVSISLVLKNQATGKAHIATGISINHVALVLTCTSLFVNGRNYKAEFRRLKNEKIIINKKTNKEVSL